MDGALEIFERISVYLEEEKLITPSERMLFMEFIMNGVWS